MNKRTSDINDIYGVRQSKWDSLSKKDRNSTETGFHHSRVYHKYFRGYTEIRWEKENGKFTFERYYTQPWIMQDAREPVYWSVRLLYILMIIGSAYLYVHAMTGPDLMSNTSWLVAIPGMPSAIMLFLLSVTALVHLFAPRKMTLWDYESSVKRLKYMSLITAGIIALTAVMMLIVTVIYDLGQIKAELFAIGQVLLAAVLAGAIYFLEKDVSYIEVPNDTQLPEGEAYEIW